MKLQELSFSFERCVKEIDRRERQLNLDSGSVAGMTNSVLPRTDYLPAGCNL